LKPNYSNKLEELLKRVRPRFAITHDLEFRNCFGAVAGYVDGNIFASGGKFGLALRLPSQTLSELFGEPDVSPLKYFEKGHVKKEYAVIPERIINNCARFRKLLDKSVKFALSVSLKE
jgi:TfoX/Sxy family transcriptional regulator of competence genes